MLKPMDEDARRKSAEKRDRQKKTKAKYNLPSQLKAIRLNCIECMCGSKIEVKHCQVTQYVLFPFRFGCNPTEEAFQVSVFDNQGNLVGQRPLHEVKEAA
jgi:hypothetical protein